MAMDHSPRPRPAPGLPVPRPAPGAAALALVLSLGLMGGAAGLRAGEAVLIASEDNHWEGVLRRSADQIRRGEYRPAVQALQELVDDAATGRALMAFPEDFTARALAGSLTPPGEEPAEGRDTDAAQPVDAEGGRLRPASGLFVPVADAARDLLSQLPPEGAAVYKALYGGPAEDLYQRALSSGDPQLLARAADNYFPCEAGRKAADRLADLHFEEGRFAAALPFWRALIAAEAAGPAKSARRRAVRLKLLLALRFLGREAEYESEKRLLLSEEESQGGSPSQAGTAAWIEGFESAHPFPSQAVAVAPGMEPVPPPPFPARRLGFDWNSPFWAKKGIAKVGAAARNSFERRSFSFEREAARAFPFFPRFEAGGEEGFLYLSGVYALHRLSVATGRLEVSYRQPLEDPALLNFQEKSESPIYTSGTVPGEGEGAGVVIGSYLSNLVKFRHYMGYEITADIPTRSLAAYEPETGKLHWKTGSLTLGREEKPVSLTSPVLIRGGRVFAGGWQQHGYIDGVLVAIDLSTGALLWHQLVASSQMEGTMFGELAREPLASCLAERDGVIYYCTNLGAVAALEASSGRILWLTTYDSMEVKPAEGRRSEFRKVVWGVNPPVLVGDILYLTPRDSVYLYAIQAGSGAGRRGAGAAQPGRILWSHPNGGEELRDLLGYSGGYLYFTGSGGVQALDVRDGPGSLPRRISSPLLHSEEGRGALTAAGVVAVGRGTGFAGSVERGSDPDGDNHLWLVDLALTGCLDLSGPLPRSDQGTHGGNVTVVGGRAFVTSRDLVASFSARPELEPKAASATVEPREPAPLDGKGNP